MFRKRKGLYKTEDQVRAIRRAGLATARMLDAVQARVAPGITTAELDAVARRSLADSGATSNFALEPGYRHAICVSVNDEVVHGVPGDRVIEAGDIVSVDAGAIVDGWNGDSAITVVVPGGRPDVTRQRQTLSDVTERSMWAGIAQLARSKHVNEAGAAVERAIRGEPDGERYGILREYVGHGIGRSMHEDPPIFNYAVSRPGIDVEPGLVICIEPMVTDGTEETVVTGDDWTVVTADGSDGAHWEHEIAVTSGGVWVLTAQDGGKAGLAPYGVSPHALGR